MIIYINIIHLNKVIEFEVDRKVITLNNLKKMIQNLEKIPYNRFTLVFKNNELDNNFTLDTYGISNIGDGNNVLSLIFNNCDKFPYGRFNHTASNFKLFGKRCVQGCPTNTLSGIRFIEDNNGNFLTNGKTYKVTGDTSTLTFIQNPLRQWVLPNKLIYRDVSEGNKCKNIFKNTAHHMTRSERISLLSNNRIKR